MKISTKLIRELGKQTHDAMVVARLLRATGLLAAIFFLGTFGYYYLTDGQYSMLDCAYMTVITLTTVGFTEVITVRGNPTLEIFTIMLIFFGMGTVLYFLSLLTAFVVEGDLRDLLWEKRMNKRINEMSQHFICCGIGETGSHVFGELVSGHYETVVIDCDRERIKHLLGEHPEQTPFLIGDATEDDTLRNAGIERAAGVVFSLGNDRDNLFATISARRLNPDILIVTRGEDPKSEEKFIMAGATSVIFTNVLGGMRMAAELIRPEVTSFLDIMIHDHGSYRRVEELEVPDGAHIIGKKLREVKIREVSDALVIAVYLGNDRYKFNPGPDFEIESGQKLVCLVLVDDIPEIEEIIRNG